MSGRPVSTPLDTSPLTARADRAALRAFRAGLPASVRPSYVGIVVPALAVMVACALFLGTWSSLIGFGDLVSDPGPGGWRGLLLVLLPSIGIPLLLVFFAIGAVSARSGRRQFALARFAHANGLRYEPVVEPVTLPGMIFGVGSNASGRDLVIGDDGLVVGNHRFVTGSGKNRSTHRWGFASLALDTTLPHIVLDATSNNSLFGASNLPVPFDRSQRLGLEGDFDKHFTLYCPAGYESDALYLFTPDIMARFIDRAAEFDIEIVDDRLFLYTRGDLATLDPATWTWLWGTLAALTEKLAQWQRWRDERLGTTTTGPLPSTAPAPAIIRPPRGVHRSGQRLRQTTHWIWLVIFVGLAALGLVNLVADIASPP
ncbi:hypothetical protein ACEXQD_11705 [Herbiconiux sp. P15]|uniref:hypothetical protein n=1 Tax=Herbiconiux liukaitaii TaxID=3342799 RepID=UPI0035B9AA12